ncbi:MAG: flagellar basal body-associated FliL family protein [Ectothiorhodospiraceae bacterium]|nr:flagellar basal body-associated FliL family protein [Ectothiorhodospiraceae bacterium]MCH8504010.1 flagellar basal body-associated FliL family protein [Ectothiorhodospiraceae bacterium]
MSGNRQKGASKLIIILILLVFVLMLTGTGAALYLAGVFGGDDDAPMAVAGSAEERSPEVAAPPPGGPPIYKELERLTVNLGAGQGARARVLQTTVQVMARQQSTLDGLAEHMPMVRNSLILLYSSQDYDALLTREGKEALREETKSEINDILMRQRVPGEVEGVFFTSFVMQ